MVDLPVIINLEHWLRYWNAEIGFNACKSANTGL